MYVCVPLCVYTCVRTCIYMYMCFVFVCVCVCVRVVHAVRAIGSAMVRVCYIYIYTCMNMCIYIYTHINMCVHIYIFICLCPCIYMCLHTYVMICQWSESCLTYYFVVCFMFPPILSISRACRRKNIYTVYVSWDTRYACAHYSTHIYNHICNVYA